MTGSRQPGEPRQSEVSRPVKRRRRQDDAQQPDLFAAAGPRWVQEHWRWWARATHHEYDVDPLHLWATTFHELSAGTRLHLDAMCAQILAHGSCEANLATMASWTSSSVKATRARLDALLQTGVILLRPIHRAGSSAPMGYEVRMMVDESDRDRALGEGFSASRVRRPARQREIQP